MKKNMQQTFINSNQLAPVHDKLVLDENDISQDILNGGVGNED